MTFVCLAAMWVAVPMALFAWVLVVRRRTLMRIGSPHSLSRYILVSCTDHATFATQGTGLTLLVGDALAPHTWLAAVLCAAMYAGAHALMVLDVALFVQGGLRMQWEFLRLSDTLVDFARGRPWRLQTAAIGLGILALGAAGGIGFYLLLRDRGKTPDWELVPAIVVAMLASTVVRRGLPIFLMYEWTNAPIVVQVKFCTGLARRLMRRQHRHLRDAVGVPKALVPGMVRSCLVDPKFPLLRRISGFEGQKHFSLGIEMDAGGRSAAAPRERPHVVIIFLESLRAKDVGALGAKHRVTPHLDDLSQKGVLWERFYANGTYTAPALTAAIYGVLPRFAGVSLQMHTPPVALRGLPHLFGERGYQTAFFSDGPMDWENKREFFLRNGFAHFFGQPSIMGAFPEAPANTWNFDDAYLFAFHAQWLLQCEAQNRPSFSVLLTVTNHHPFEAPLHAAEPVTDAPYGSDYYRYLRTIMYTDTCLGNYMAELEKKGLADKTIFMIAGDHGQQVTPEDKMDWSGQYHDEGVHVPLVLVARDRISGGKRIGELASQVDLVPTVMDMLGMRDDVHACGTSLVRHCDSRQAITLHPWKPGLYANRLGEFRYVHSLETGVGALFHLERDAAERHNISKAYPGLFAQQQQQVELLQAYLEALYMADRVAPPAATWTPPPPPPPDGSFAMPRELDALKVLLRDAIMAGYGPDETTPREAHIVALCGLCLAAVWLTDAERLTLAQLGLFALSRVTYGEARNAARTALDALMLRALAVPAGQSLPAGLTSRLDGLARALKP